ALACPHRSEFVTTLSSRAKRGDPSRPEADFCLSDDGSPRFARDDLGGPRSVAQASGFHQRTAALVHRAERLLGGGRGDQLVLVPLMLAFRWGLDLEEV